MRPINDENIDEIMFQLLEGEITGEEREYLLEAINADPAYAKLWETWQNTILQSDKDDLVFDSEKLKKRRVTPVFKMYWSYAAAAAVVLTLGFAIFSLNHTSNEEVRISGAVPPKPNKPVIQTPAQPDKITNNPLLDTHKDTLKKNLRESIRYIANSTPMETRENDELQNINEQNQITIENVELKPKKESPIVQEQAPQTEFAVNTNSSEVFVTVENESNFKSVASENTNKSFFRRLIGGSKIKLVNDSNALTNKKIVIENKKYQIIAGF